MNNYLKILKAYVRHSLLASAFFALCVLGLAVWLALSTQLNTMFSIPFIGAGLCVMAGVSVVSTMLSLLQANAAGQLPRYHQRVVTVGVALALAIWAMTQAVPMHALAGVVGLFTGRPEVWEQAVRLFMQVEDDVPALHWMPLWSYGVMGVWGVPIILMHRLMRGRGWLGFGQSLLLQAVFVLPAIAIGALLSYKTTRSFLLTWPVFNSLPGLTPLNLLCLLIGPLAWPLLVARANSVDQATQPHLQKRIGDLFINNAFHARGGMTDPWLLQRLVRTLHRRSRPMPDFLGFIPLLLGYWKTGVALLLVWVPMQWAGFVPQDFLTGVWPFLLMVIIPLAWPVLDPHKVAQLTLLPGAPNRRNVARWVLLRLAFWWSVGAALALAPILVWLWILDTSRVLDRNAAVMIVCLTFFAVAFVYWRAPTAKIGQVRAAEITVTVLLFALGVVLGLDDFITWVGPWVVGAALATLLGLGLLFFWLGLRRWERCDLGGQAT